MRAREQSGRWESGERGQFEGEGGADDYSSGCEVLFEEVMFGLKGFWGEEGFFGEEGVEMMLMMKAVFVGDWGFVWGCDCGSNWARDWSWDWACDSGWGWDSLYSFFSSFLGWVSPMPLLLFKLDEISISSGRSSGEWCFFFFFFLRLICEDSVNAGDLDVTDAVTFAVVASVVIASAIASVVVVDDNSAASSIVAVAVAAALFWGGWGFLHLRITWVHSSSLSGWSPGSRYDLLGKAAEVVAVCLVVFWGRDLAKWPTA